MKYVGKQLVLYIYTYHILYLLSKYFCIYYAHLYLYSIAGNSSFKNQLKTRTLLEVSRKTVVRVWSEKKVDFCSKIVKCRSNQDCRSICIDIVYYLYCTLVKPKRNLIIINITMWNTEQLQTNWEIKLKSLALGM